MLVTHFGAFLCLPPQLHSNKIVRTRGGAGQIYNYLINFNYYFNNYYFYLLSHLKVQLKCPDDPDLKLKNWCSFPALKLLTYLTW